MARPGSLSKNAFRDKVIEVDGLRFSTSKGWGLFRVSNTEPAIVARFEAKTDSELRDIIKHSLELLHDTPVKIDELNQIFLEM